MQTKNLSGRLLVGLRWWNETTDEGSNWRFETLGEVSCDSEQTTAGHTTHLLDLCQRDFIMPLHVAGPEADQQKGLCMLLVVALHHGESGLSRL